MVDLKYCMAMMSSTITVGWGASLMRFEDLGAVGQMKV